MKKYIALTLAILLLVSLVALPVDTKAKTITDFENEVNRYTAQLKEKQNQVAKNDEEVAAIKVKIRSIETQISEAEDEIRALQKEIDDSNDEIMKKSEESKSIIGYYQISNGENVYLEYAFGASSITDMIYRMSIVEQLTEYNEKVMKELEALIAKNEERQKVLDKKKIDLRALREQLEAEKERINAESAALKETMPSIQQQIDAANANLKYYKSLKCGADEDIQACQYRIQQSQGGSLPSVNGWYRPIQYGYITGGYDGYGGHLGLDMSSSNKTIEIYPIANGQIFYNSVDNYGALVVKIRHNINGKYIYSTYAHMSEVYSNIRVGMNITAFTPIGKMGSTGWSTGPHLHLEMTTCDWNRGGGCSSYTQYTKNTINPTRYVYFPNSWNNR